MDGSGLTGQNGRMLGTSEQVQTHSEVIKLSDINRTWPGAIRAYITSMKAAGRSPGTIRIHNLYLSLLRRISPCPGHVTRQTLEVFLANERWAPETRKSARATARVFFAWCVDVGVTKSNPAARLAPVSVPAGVARPALDKDILAALAYADPRVTLMIRLAAYAGLRCGEIAKVHSSDFDGQLLYVTGKGSKRRAVPILDGPICVALRSASGFLFPGETNGHLSPGHVTKLLSNALPKGVTGHMLRHRFATTAYAGTRDLLAVGTVLGHSKPETTKRYVQLPQDALIAAVAAAGAA